MMSTLPVRPVKHHSPQVSASPKLRVTKPQILFLFLGLTLLITAGAATSAGAHRDIKGISASINHNSRYVQPVIRIQQKSGPRAWIVNSEQSLQIEQATSTPTATGTYTPTPISSPTEQPANPDPDNSENVTLTPPARTPTIFVSGVEGVFYPGTTRSFVLTTQTPAMFSKSFPSLNFNPDSMGPCTNTPVVDRFTIPFTDLSIAIPCEEVPARVTGSPTASAGEGDLRGFQVVFTGDLYVSEAGDITLNLYSDDSFILGFGPNRDGSGSIPLRRGGTFTPPTPTSPTPWPTTLSKNYVVVGQRNDGTWGGANETIHFSRSGYYPFEIDYAEDGLADLSLTIEYTAGTPVPIGPSATPTCNPGPIPCIGESQNPSPESAVLNGVFAVNQDDVWAVGAQTTPHLLNDVSFTEHWDGATWTIVPVSQSIGELHSVAALQLNGQWTEWAASDTGIIHLDPNTTSWYTPYPGVPGAKSLYAAGGNIYAAGGNTLQIGGGSPFAWSTLTAVPQGASLMGVAAGPGDNGYDVWAVGSKGANPFSLHRRNGVWTTENIPVPAGATSAVLNSVDIVTAVSSVGVAAWAVGSYTDSHGDQHTLTEYYTHWPDMANDTYEWRIVPSPDSGFGFDELHSVWVTASLNVWAVGKSRDYFTSIHPLMLHWTGTEWARSDSPYLGSNGELRAVASHSPALSLWSVGTYRSGSSQDQTLVEYIKPPPPPGATTSWYEQQVSATTHDVQGCNAAKTPVSGTDGKLIILDYGQPQQIPGGYGTKLIGFGTIVSNPQIEAAVKAYIDGYERCSGGSTNNPAIIILGVNNSYGSGLTSAGGAAWAGVVNNLHATFTAVPNLGIAGGIDAEPGLGFDPSFTPTANWAKGFLSSTSQNLYNFGSIDAYPYRPTPGPGTPTPIVPEPFVAHDTWNTEQHYQISHGLAPGRIFAIPEAYTNFKTGYWYVVAQYGFDRHQEVVNFSGPICCDKLSISDSWQALWLVLNGDYQTSQRLKYSTIIQYSGR